MRLLMVDDDPGDVFLVEELTDDFHNYQVSLDSESNPDLAEARILAGEHDLYLIDYRLGGLSGLDLLRKCVDQVDAPFVMLTGFGSREVDREAMSCGAADFISKDQLTVDSLERVLRHAFDRHQVLSELKRANRDKSMFLARLSHEIRTPMTGMLGIVDILAQMPLYGRQSELVQMLSSSCASLFELINDILDFSKVEAGQVELECLPFDLRSLSEGALALVSFSCDKRKDLDIRVVYGAGVPQWVEGDPTRLRQVILNLLSNAVKFTEKGEVLLRITSTPLDGDPNCLCFEVIDTGIGMTEAEQQDIFLSFRQANRSTSRMYGGCGLGLSICKHLVALMGGELKVESRKGSGSTFSFRLSQKPAIGPEVRPESSVTDLPNGSCPGMSRLLVVEDNPVMQNLFLRMMRRLGLDITLVENGEAAVAAVRDTPFDLIFMACEMPVLDGYDTCRQIRTLEQDGRTPIIGISAQHGDHMMDRCRAAGMDDLISKPIRMDQLEKALLFWSQTNSAAARTSSIPDHEMS